MFWTLHLTQPSFLCFVQTPVSFLAAASLGATVVAGREFESPRGNVAWHLDGNVSKAGAVHGSHFGESGNLLCVYILYQDIPSWGSSWSMYLYFRPLLCFVAPIDIIHCNTSTLWLPLFKFWPKEACVPIVKVSYWGILLLHAVSTRRAGSRTVVRLTPQEWINEVDVCCTLSWLKPVWNSLYVHKFYILFLAPLQCSSQRLKSATPQKSTQ